MVDAVVGFAIQKLSDFLTQEVNIRIGVKDGVRWLKDELAYLQSSVKAAEAKQEIDLIRVWINSVKDVANEAVIVLERFSTIQEDQAGQKQGVMDRLRSCVCICKKEASLYDIGKEIESLKGRVVEIKNRRDEHNINSILATPKVQQRTRTLLRATSFENHVDVVGFEDDVQILLDALKTSDLSLSMISIHGMGGLGKTTLASKLYHSSELSNFKSRAWVCVSQEYNIKDVLKTIIKSLTRHEVGHEQDLLMMDEVDLLHQLRKLLQDRGCYLVVIDDIWDIEAWEKIKKAFPDKKNGSRVIVTTRNKRVAQKVDDRCFVHELRFLREDESWHLFSKRAKPSPIVENLGMEMVGKCRGLPLAIVVLSGLLLHKKSYEDWSKVKDHIWRQLKGDSVEIQEILSLSYDDLPFQMRQCFLYLARFPEDYSFGVNKLKLLWIAEDFISEVEEEDGLVMEDLAEDYLNELINRNMIQITNFQLDGEVHYCRVHDLVRDLAIQKATEHKLLATFDSNTQHPSSLRLLQGQPRHVIYNEIGEYLKLLGPNSDDLKLRSLAIIDEKNLVVNIEEMKSVYTRFIYLKVLDLVTVKLDKIPQEIGDLVLLQFLGLMGNVLDPHSDHSDYLVIPPTIGKLKRLQTLCGSISTEYEFPSEICELKELRHVDNFGGFGNREAGRSLKISSHQIKIQTLESIWIDDWIQIDTVRLTNLQTLVITCASLDKYASYTLDSIANLTSLQKFAFRSLVTVIPTIKPLRSCKRLKSVGFFGKMKDASELCYLPDTVMHITLVWSNFQQDPMPALGSLPNLIGLDLDGIGLHSDNMPVEKKMVCSHASFPSLQIFRLNNLFNVEEWLVEDGAMPSLRGASIGYCPALKIVPQQLRCAPAIPDTFTFWRQWDQTTIL